MRLVHSIVIALGVLAVIFIMSASSLPEKSTGKKTLIVAGTVETGLTTSLQKLCDSGWSIKHMATEVRFPQFTHYGRTDEAAASSHISLVIVILEK